MSLPSAPGGRPRFRAPSKAWLALPLIVIVVAVVVVGTRTFRPMPGAPSTPVPQTVRPDTPRGASAALAQGDADFDRGDYEQAIADYGRAIELKPDYAEAYNNRAYTYMTIRDYPNAIADLNSALRIRPDYVNALMNRGDIYNFYYEVDYARAISDYDHVLAVDPSAAAQTSLCGHRAIAANHGMSVGLYLRMVVLRIGDPCGSAGT